MTFTARVAPQRFFRRAAELLFGPLVFNRRLPPECGGGFLRVSPRISGLKYLLKPSRSWDPDLLRVARLLVKPGNHVWDIGANVGLFSKASAFYSGSLGSVLAIEADIEAAVLLLSSSKMSVLSDAPITVLPVAVTDKLGIAKLCIAKRARATNALFGYGSTQTGGFNEVRFVPSWTLDELLNIFPLPQVLKIDVEGAESLVIKGAHSILSEVRPKIYCEVSLHSIDNIIKILESYGYSLWGGDGFDLRTPRAVTKNTRNIIGLPPNSGLCLGDLHE